MAYAEKSVARLLRVRGWIAEGAPYAKHWAFVKPQRAATPATNDPANRNPIDAFIGAELQKHELAFSPEADPHTLIRRLSLDFVGLPPAPEQVSNFTKDWATLSTDAREARIGKLVDELLASPHFGEKWARMHILAKALATFPREHPAGCAAGIRLRIDARTGCLNGRRALF